MGTQQWTMLCKCQILTGQKSKTCKWKFSIPIWYKNCEELSKDAVIRNNILWIRKNGNLVLYVPFVYKQELMTSADSDLMVGHDGVKKCKEWFKECYFWPDMDNDLQKHMCSYLKCQVSKKRVLKKTIELQPLLFYKE